MINFQEKASQTVGQTTLNLSPTSLKSTSLRPVSEVALGRQAPTFISLTHSGRYFDTRQQILLRDATWFEDSFEASTVSGSTTATGLFSLLTHRTDMSGSNSDVHPTSSIVVDASGAQRKILSPSIDFYASGSVDGFRNGVEISRDSQWTAGLVKISAGTPGHLVERRHFGVPSLSVIDPDIFYEVDSFDPVKYVESGGDAASFTYPIVTSDRNLLENEVLDGIIEPFPIRSVISNFSTYFPFEPRGIRSTISEGNTNGRGYTEFVLDVDKRDVSLKSTWYVDDCDRYGVVNDASGSFVGVIVGYVNDSLESIDPWIDEHRPAGRRLSATLYDDEMTTALNAMLPGGIQHVPEGSRSSTCGFIYEGASGTDSIAYGGRIKS